jgi:glycosyltransferase involved in cell wall biosynthesis
VNVALLNPVYWPEVRRGSERFARELANGLIAAGHHPRLVTSHPGRTTRAVEDGLAITRHWRPPSARLRRRMYEPWLTHLPLSYLDVRNGDDDVLHALYPTDGAVAAAAKGDRPAVLSYMGLPHRTALANRRWRVRLTLDAVRGCDAVVALSQTAAEHFERWLGVHARVIAPGVDLEAFTPDPAARAPVPTILCSADAAEPRKRVPLLIDAFSLVRRERPEARLVLDAGGNPHPPAMGVERRVLDTPGALAAANREAWVAALPSWGEAFGLVLLEAMACGTPVVGANREATPEVVDTPAVGRLFDGDDPHALAEALLEALDLAEDPGTAAACRARAEQFPWSATTAAYIALYDELRA